MRSTLRLLSVFAVLLATLLASATDAAQTTRSTQTILVLGDSLSAGFGIRQSAAWPALLQRRLDDRGFDYSVANASISGETTAGGRARIEAALKRYRPAIVIIALGANDGLRGLPLTTAHDNLAAIVQSARLAKARVLLVGMRLPPNYGPYAKEFGTLFASLATHQRVPLVPFLLDGIADQPSLFQTDGLHPTAEAQARLLDNVWAGLAPLLK